MKPNQISNRKLNLDKQTIQKLDSDKMANVNAANNPSAAVSAVSLLVTEIACGVICLATLS